jgi:hypothetical protein
MVKVDSLCRVRLGGADHDHKLRSEGTLFVEWCAPFA